MLPVTRADIEELARVRTGPCASIYEPVPHGADATRTRHDVRTRNLMREAARRLRARGLDARDAERVLQPARRLLDDYVRGPHHGHGLAVFVSSALTRAFEVPGAIDPVVVVDDLFHVTPLLAALTAPRHFYVLALSLNATRLLRGTRDAIAEVVVPGMPASFREALQRDHREPALQLHTGTPSRPTRRAAVFHGHAEDGKADILRFFRQIDRAVTAVIRDAPAPLVLATVEYLAPIYAAASTHAWLVGAPIPGNPEGRSAPALHARAWPLVAANLDGPRRAAEARYLALRGTGKAAGDVPSIVAAALDGRVDVLFARRGVQAAGDIPARTRAVVAGEQTPGRCEDVLNVAVIHTVLNRGTVYVLPPRQMPDDAVLAALFRY